MSAQTFDPVWLAALRAQLDEPPLRPRVPLTWGTHLIGTVEPEFLEGISLRTSSIGQKLLSKEVHSGSVSWRVMGELTPSLAHIAQALREAKAGQVAADWRDEQLAVHAWPPVPPLRVGPPDGVKENSGAPGVFLDAGQLLGTVERGVVRPLGVATQAVHLVGRSHDGRFWVQRRSLTKANDPGLWDTLMGGMVAASDTLDTALVRETWEEAGLRIGQMQQLLWGGRMTQRAPARGDGAGYVVEHTEWFHAVLPEGMVPINQDGEVACFELLERDALVARLHNNEFTTEAALVWVAALSVVSDARA